MSMAEVQIALQVLNLLVLPAMLGVGRAWWALERRMLKIELKLGIDEGKQ